MVEMKVYRVAVEAGTNAPLVILRDLEEKTVLPIRIGKFEASAISMKLEQVKIDRPLTHDLIHAFMESVDTKVTKVVVNALKENTYYAEISVERGDRRLVIDARPSDAIVLALKAEAPIYVAEEVLMASSIGASAEDGQLKIALSAEAAQGASGEPDAPKKRKAAGQTRRKPKLSPERVELQRLEVALQRAVEKEAFEQAAELRDKIRMLKGQKPGLTPEAEHGAAE